MTVLKKKRRRIELIKKQMKKDKGAVVAAVCLLLIILVSVFAFLSPYDPETYDVSHMLEVPGIQHWFGTDEIGRDYFTRALYGGRVSITVGILSMLVSTIIGVSVGSVSGYYGGKIDSILMRIVDVISSIPWMILVTVVGIYLKPGFFAIITVIGLFTWMRTARLVRAVTMTVKEREYVQYAKASGQGDLKIITKHILPGVFPTFIITATTSISNAIIMESTLSFLGFGVQQPMSSWGSMLQNAQSELARYPHLVIVPGAFIIATVLCFNKLGDVLKIAVEPRETYGE